MFNHDGFHVKVCISIPALKLSLLSEEWSASPARSSGIGAPPRRSPPVLCQLEGVKFEAAYPDSSPSTQKVSTTPIILAIKSLNFPCLKSFVPQAGMADHLGHYGLQQLVHGTLSLTDEYGIDPDSAGHLERLQGRHDDRTNLRFGTRFLEELQTKFGVAWLSWS